MDDLEQIESRLSDIAAERKALDAEGAELEVAARVLRRLRGRPVAIEVPITATPRAVAGSVFGFALKGQQAQAMEVLPEDGTPMSRADFKQAMDAKREGPMSENAYITMLSRLASAGLVVRDGDTVRRKVGGADVS